MTLNRETAWLETWYGQRKWSYWLLPLMWLFRLLAGVRRFYLERFAQQSLSIPVIIVGNISVGGTGKTPLLIALVEHLKARGFKPGVVSRGYGGHAHQYPFLLTPNAQVEETGDEPLSIYLQTGCSVCVGADRVASARALQQQGCDIILSDDGLQHYRLGRSLELAVVDGQRGFGNGFCLPVGPLREPVSRLQQVNIVIVNGGEQVPLPTGLTAVFSMTIHADYWVRLVDQQHLPLSHLPPSTRVHALAGIGNPQRFFTSLCDLQLQIIEHEFPDHYAYKEQDFIFAESLPLVMTAKDAIKCRKFAQQEWYYLAIHAQLPDTFWRHFDVALQQFQTH